jgi:hypothetical protein
MKKMILTVGLIALPLVAWGWSERPAALDPSRLTGLSEAEKREALAARQAALDLAEEAKIAALLRSGGASAEHAAGVARQVREHLQTFGAPVDADKLFPHPEREGHAERPSRESVERLATKLREFHLNLAGEYGKLQEESQRNRGCDSGYDSCISGSDTIFYNCLEEDGLSPRWCLDLYVGLLRACNDYYIDCIARSPV